MVLGHCWVAQTTTPSYSQTTHLAAQYRSSESERVTDDVPPVEGIPNGELAPKSGADTDANGCAEDAFVKPPSIAHTTSMGFGHSILGQLTLRCGGCGALAKTEERRSTVATLPTCKARNRKPRRKTKRTSVRVIVRAHDAAKQCGYDSVDRGTVIKGTVADVASLYICEESMLQQRWTEFSFEQLFKQLPSSFVSFVHKQNSSCPVQFTDAVISAQGAT